MTPAPRRKVHPTEVPPYGSDWNSGWRLWVGAFATPMLAFAYVAILLVLLAVISSFV